MPRIISILAILVLSACSTIDTGSQLDVLNSGNITQVENKVESLLNVADDIYENEDYVGSYMMYSSAWEQNNGADPALDIRAKMGRAKAQLRLGQHQFAMEIYTDLLADGHSSAQLQLGMAEAYFAMGKVNEAQVLMASLSADEFSSPHFYTLTGVLHELKLEHLEARVNYEKAMSLQLDKTNSLLNLAFSFALTGDFVTSFSLLEITSDDGKNTALIHALKGDLPKAEEVITKYLFRNGYGASEVAQNMAFYTKLADLTPTERVRAVIFGIIAE